MAGTEPVQQDHSNSTFAKILAAHAFLEYPWSLVGMP